MRPSGTQNGVIIIKISQPRFKIAEPETHLFFGEVENAYGIHYRARLPYLACITNIWPLSLRDSSHMLVTYAR